VLWEACSEHSVPPPAVNAPVGDYTVDFLWPEARLVVEADGGDHLDRRQRDADNARDADLGRAGYLVRRYGWAVAQDGASVANARRDPCGTAREVATAIITADLDARSRRRNGY
jgi:uncharacterized protein DUF559